MIQFVKNEVGFEAIYDLSSIFKNAEKKDLPIYKTHIYVDEKNIVATNGHLLFFIEKYKFSALSKIESGYYRLIKLGKKQITWEKEERKEFDTDLQFPDYMYLFDSVVESKERIIIDCRDMCWISALTKSIRNCDERKTFNPYLFESGYKIIPDSINIKDDFLVMRSYGINAILVAVRMRDEKK